MTEKRLIIAVDGYSSTGKSTVAKRLAAHLGYTYIDTGAMYRMVTLKAMRDGILREGKVDEERLEKMLEQISLDFRYNTRTARHEAYLDRENVEEEIRGLAVSNGVSLIASFARVREVLVARQQAMGARGGVVMDGRDIGSVVFPAADVKFFMTASPDTRARRRYEEMIGKGESVTLEEVKANVQQRDYTDAHRAVGPLVKTPDAIEIDTSAMTVEEELARMLTAINACHASRD
jgi:cytidylate kinase